MMYKYSVEEAEDQDEEESEQEPPKCLKCGIVQSTICNE